MLREHGRLGTAYGQVVLAGALLDDFATLLLLSLTIAVLGGGSGFDFMLVLVLLVAFAAAVKLGRRAARQRALPWLSEEIAHATVQLPVRGAIALLIGWVVLANLPNVAVVLGAVLAGAPLRLCSRDRDLPVRAKLDAIRYGFFLPVFFIMVGVAFDPRVVLASPRTLLPVHVLILSAYAVRMLPALLLRGALPWRPALAAGMLLSSRLSLIIAASAIALRLHLITPALHAAVILVAVVTCTCSPALFIRLLPVGQAARRRGVILVGDDGLARPLAERLRGRGEAVVCLAGAPTVEGLARAGANHAAALLAMGSAGDDVRRACALARSRFSIPTVIACNGAAHHELEALGVRVVQPTLGTLLALEGALRFPATFAMLLEPPANVDVLEVQMAQPALDGRALRSVRFPGDVRILALRRDRDLFVPNGDTVLRRRDALTLIGNPADVQRAATQLGDSGLVLLASPADPLTPDARRAGAPALAQPAAGPRLGSSLGSSAPPSA